MQTLRNAENTRSFNNDKGIIRLPRQYEKLLKKVRKIKDFGNFKRNFYTIFTPKF